MIRRYKAYFFVILLIIAALAIFDSINSSNVAEDVRKEKDKLASKVTRLEKENENRSNLFVEVREEKEDLEENLSQMEEEVESLRSAFEYQEFTAAIDTIESYKASQSFQEATKFMAFKAGQGYFTTDKAGNCPCGFGFNGKGFEWIPNAVLDLKEFRIEKDKVYLTYNTVEDIKNNYQFVMTKAIGRYDSVKKWRIEDIKLVTKEK
ncbi:hypothetical protein M5V91_28610 (plasmid) [Cytobacillus pseudoceanisediminis]|uniref:hypothetical protein n=1 Tax=Cytobacillus pseudoceanisediminis TaxID=3051614 RepID=UPI002186FD92|nr:hypothetical protein [Cytobacillus pseudoceanisediminis]UQX57111.1 hypothetical protein M5V91_28610 [Cytobacillus pseudoceanisediminis]